MADTLEELMTDEPEDDDDFGGAAYWESCARNALRAELRPGYRALREKAERLDALEADPKSFYAALIRSYESRARALRESHDALRDSLQEFAEGPWHNSKCAGWSEDEGETEYDMRTVMRPELCDCAISRARAALAKAEALGAVGAQG